MKLRELKSLAISASFLVLCAACSSGDKDSVDLATPWLGPLHGFERVSGEDDFGVFLKRTSGATVKLERSIVSSPEIIVSTSSDLEAMSPAAYERVRSLLSEVFRQELAKQIPTANSDAERGAASHVIHAALTNITVTRTTNAATAVQVSELQFSFENSTFEAEIRETTSNARRAVVVLPTKAEKTGWNALRAQLSAFARQIAAEIGKARSAINTQADQPPAPAVKAPAKE